MRIRFVFCSCFFFFCINLVLGQQIDSSAYKIVEKKIQIIDVYLKKNGIGSFPEMQTSAKFLIELTGIASESDIDYFGQIFPTSTDYKLWNRWFIRNKQYLYWDKEINSVLLKKAISIEAHIKNDKASN